MKFTWMKWSAVAVAGLMGASIAMAQSTTTTTPPAQPKPDPTIAQRKENQQDRIANGSPALGFSWTPNCDEKE